MIIRNFFKPIATALTLLGACYSVFASTSQDDIIQKNILIYINEYRVAHRLNPLKMNAIINEEARKHSVDMAKHRIPFGHQYFSERIKRIYAHIPHCNGGAENVAFNYRDTRELVRQWLKSPGHRQNIDGHYDVTGIGIARDKNNKLYYTQMFIRTH